MVKCVAPLGSHSARGKVGSVIYETGRFGQYAKMHTPQRKHPTEAQIFQNYKFGIVADKWRLLTEEQKEYWNEQAKGKKLTGFNLYIKENLNLTGFYGSAKYGVSKYV